MRVLLVLALALILAILGSAASVLWYFDRNLPDIRELVDYNPPPGRPFVLIAAMPALVIRAFLSAEDADFYGHSGVSLVMILRAAAVDVIRLASHKRPIGASTITQQLVKNFVLTDELSLSRKIREALLADRLERRLSKDRILEIYLNEVYLGCGAHGVSEAAFNYFDKSLSALTVEEAAFLAALPKAPSHYNPLRFPRAAKRRRNWVLEQMVENGYLSRHEAMAAKAIPIQLVTRRCIENQLNRARIPGTTGLTLEHELTSP